MPEHKCKQCREDERRAFAAIAEAEIACKNVLLDVFAKANVPLDKKDIREYKLDSFGMINDAVDWDAMAARHKVVNHRDCSYCGGRYVCKAFRDFPL